MTVTTNAPVTTQAVSAAPNLEAAPTAPAAPGVSQAAIFAREHAKNAAKGMLAALDEINRNAVKITKIALGVSMPHQVSFLLGLALPFMHWNSPVEILHAAGILMLVLGAPVIADLLIVNCIKVVSQNAADKGSKKAAIWIMLLPVIASSGVNGLAPAPHWIVRTLAIFVVVAIPLSEILRFLVRPDFAQIEQMEISIEEKLVRKVEDVVEPAPVTVPVVDQKQIDKQRKLAAERAREMARQNPNLSVAALARAAGCGTTAAKTALKMARESELVVTEV
jgi:hypothetical protein